MADNNSPVPSKNKWAYIGCGSVILMIIALFLIVFWLGPEFAIPWGKDQGPGP